MRGLFFAAAFLSLVISIAIVAALLGEAVRWLFGIDIGWLWSSGWFPRQDRFDVLTLLSGTMIIAGTAMLVAAPLGLGAAAYLSEYARPRTRRILKPILETLAEHPERRARLLRAPVDQPRVRPDDLLHGRHVQPARCGPRRGDPHDPARGFGGRGRDARRSARAPGGRVRHRLQTPDGDDEGRVPGRRLGHRGVADPRLLAGGRRDDGRRDRGRRDGGSAPHVQPARARADDDRGDLVARDRLGPGPRARGSRSTACTSWDSCCS